VFVASVEGIKVLRVNIHRPRSTGILLIVGRLMNETCLSPKAIWLEANLTHNHASSHQGKQEQRGNQDARLKPYDLQTANKFQTHTF
jgi:hypothetical protein